MHSPSLNTPESRPFILAGATIEPLLNLISRKDQHIQVERQVMRLLLFLIAHVDRVVTRETLMASLWDTSFPKDEALTQAVSKLRKALGSDHHGSPIIQTIRKVGYRLHGPVSYLQSSPYPSTSIPQSRPSRQFRNSRVVALGIMILFIGLASLRNNISVRTGGDEIISADDGVKKVRLIISREHEQLPMLEGVPIDQLGKEEAEQIELIEQP